MVKLEKIIALLEENSPTCAQGTNSVSPTFYNNDPMKYCDYEYYTTCPYKKEQGADYICSYYETLSLMLGKHMDVDD